MRINAYFRRQGSTLVVLVLAAAGIACSKWWELSTMRAVRSRLAADMGQRSRPQSPARKADAIGVRMIPVKAESGFRFRPDTINIHADERVAILFENLDVMPHIFVVLRQGSVNEVSATIDRMTDVGGEQALSKMTATPAAILQTSLILPGKTQTTPFVAPSVPGLYPFICASPGQKRVMQGAVKVE